MLALIDGHHTCLFFEQAFLEQMLDDIRLMLAGIDCTDPMRLAERANELWLAKQQDGDAISRVSAPTHQQPWRDSAAPPTSSTAEQQPRTGDQGKRRWCFYHPHCGVEA